MGTGMKYEFNVWGLNDIEVTCHAKLALMLLVRCTISFAGE